MNPVIDKGKKTTAPGNGDFMQDTNQPPFKPLPVTSDHAGNTRCAGFEFELGNLTIESTAKRLVERFGGELEKISAFEVNLHDSHFGKLKIERDTQLLTSLKYREWLSSVGIDFSPGAQGEYLEQEVDKLSRWLVPCEIVTQPLAPNQFDALNELVSLLEQEEAQGTQDALHYAFGLHINIGVPDFTSQTLLAYLQAMGLLLDWIINDASTDLTRRFLTNYIDPFPSAYLREIITHEYQPDVTQLIDDYLQFNPTRNRPLDMLPVFLMIDESRVLNAVDPEQRRLLKSRPAFHYRLPDCRVGKPGWCLAQEWNRWQLVEVLANNEELRHQLMTDWHERFAGVKFVPSSFWVSYINDVLKQHDLIA